MPEHTMTGKAGSDQTRSNQTRPYQLRYDPDQSSTSSSDRNQTHADDKKCLTEQPGSFPLARSLALPGCKLVPLMRSTKAKRMCVQRPGSTSSGSNFPTSGLR